MLTYTQGSTANPEDHLNVIFEMDEDDYPLGSDDMIIVDNIEFTSTCEHHMAPIRGLESPSSLLSTPSSIS